MNEQATTQRARDIIDNVLREQVGAYGFRDANVSVGYDHDGDEVLFVDVYYDLMDRPVEPSAFYGLTAAIRGALQQEGESRFPHVRNHFNERQQVAV